MRAVVLASLAIVAGCAHQQNIAEGTGDLAGSRVIVETQPGLEEDGVVADSPTGLVVETSHGTFGLYEVHRLSAIKRGRGALEGLGIGLLLGATGGALLGYSGGDDQCNDDCLFALSAGDKAVLGGVLLGSAGALVGLVVGAVRGSRDVYDIGGTPQPTPRLSPSGPPGSVTGMTLRF